MKEQGGAILEVNAGPGLLMHLKPTSGAPPRGHGHRDHLFPRTEGGHRAGRAFRWWALAGAGQRPSSPAWWAGCCSCPGKLTGVASSEACSWPTAKHKPPTPPTGPARTVC